MFARQRRTFLRIFKRFPSDEATRRCSGSPNFVPVHEPVQERQLNELSRLLSGSKRLVVLTGAGISTESGIPDYRSRGVGLYATDSHRRPVQFIDFVKDPSTRQRYWARNFAGWPRFSSVSPNASHRALQRLHERRFSSSSSDDEDDNFTLVTQNVDRLHWKAGSREAVELHGSAYTVVCMNCGWTTDRHLVQTKMLSMNAHLPTFRQPLLRMAPDGDVHLSDEAVKSFRVPECDVCGGVLKPDIVFFGDRVPRGTVDAVYDRVRRCDALLVAGSSLQVYSGYRFLLEAHERKIPIAIVNIGPTRADRLAACKVNSSCGQVLPRVVEEVLRLDY